VGALQTIRQHDRMIWIAPLGTVFSNTQGAAHATYEVLSGANLTAFENLVSPLVKEISGVIRRDDTNAAHAAITLAANTDSLGRVLASAEPAGATNFTGVFHFPFRMPISANPRNFVWQYNEDAAGSNSRWAVLINGYSI
jgi:hypothetical protein